VSQAYEVPPPDEVTAGWWAATRQHRLVLQCCGGCGHIQHPPRALCTACGATDQLNWSDASGIGTVDSCTIVERAPSPAFTPPYVVARVRLAEGPVLLTNVVDVPPPVVGIGDDVRLQWRDLPDGRALPVFGPASPELEE
jgi:uncharacterized OB-fold protein